MNWGTTARGVALTPQGSDFAAVTEHRDGGLFKREPTDRDYAHRDRTSKADGRHQNLGCSMSAERRSWTVRLGEGTRIQREKKQ